MCCWTFESLGKAWTWSGESAVSMTTWSWKASSRPVTHSWTSCRGMPRQQRYRNIILLTSKEKKIYENRHDANLCSRCSSLTSSTQPIMTLNSTVFTYIASTLALSSFPILGSFQQCGELLWRECQDGSTLCVLPCVCALHQGLQGEDTKQMPPLCSFPDRVQLSLPVRGEVPWFQIWMLSVPVRAEQDRALAASVPQDVVYSPRPNNRKDQLGLTLELQLQCLDWFYSLLPPFPPLPPDSLALPLPHHTAHFLWLFSVWIYGICLRKRATQGFLHICVSVCLSVT